MEIWSSLWSNAHYGMSKQKGMSDPVYVEEVTDHHDAEEHVDFISAEHSDPHHY